VDLAIQDCLACECEREPNLNATAQWRVVLLHQCIEGFLFLCSCCISIFLIVNITCFVDVGRRIERKTEIEI
jgi:hypothetical protein